MSGQDGTRFLIIDDHPLFREALQSAVQLEYPDVETIEARTVAEALDLLAGPKPFDLALLDLSIPGVHGFEGLLQLRTRHPRLPVVIVSGHEEPKHHLRGAVLRRRRLHPEIGAQERCLPRRSAMSWKARSTCRKATAPRRPMTISPTAPRWCRRLATLTPQQLRVLQMLRQGMLNKQIAYELQVGETTVKAHVSEILRKLNVYSRTQAVIEVSKLDSADLFR